MTKIDIFSGFLGAGKTTLIKKLIGETYKGEQLVLIENEFGDIGIDGEFLKESGIKINELNSGCICCSLVGDFSKALVEVIEEYKPDRIIIEPSGVGKLSDVVRAVEAVSDAQIKINALATVVDANKCKMYMKNFGEFFNDQIENSGCIVLSHTENIDDEKLETVIELIKEHNKDAVIISTPWDKLNGEDILCAIERDDTLDKAIKSLSEEEKCPECGGHHNHKEHKCCEHEHHHHKEHECCEHEHHHHDGEHECCGHEHHHHDDECECCGHDHHHDDECECCGHGHHHHHHADEVFTSWGMETAKRYTADEITSILKVLDDKDKYGMILRAKGVVASEDEEWIHFDYIPNEPDVRFGQVGVCGRICVIGSGINEEKIKELFSK